MAEADPVVILGGGISGLSLAWVLKSLNIPFIILEKNEILGGVIQGTSEENFHLDLGPQTFMLEAELKALIRDLNLEKSLVLANEKAQSKFIASIKNNYLKEITKNPLSAFSSGAIRITDIPFFIRDLFANGKNKTQVEDIALADLSEKIFGSHITEEVLAPAMVGIWASSLDKLSTQSLSPCMMEAYRNNTSIIKATIKNKKRKFQLHGKPSLASLKGGLKQLIQELEKSLGKENIKKKIKVLAINFSDKNLKFSHDGKVNEIRFNQIVSTIPSYALAQVLKISDLKEDDEESYSKLLNSVHYSPLGILHSKIKTSEYPNKKSGFGLLIPPGHSKALIGTIFTSEMFQGRSPLDYTLFTSFVGGSIYPEQSDLRNPENIQLALSELKQILKLNSTPELVKATYWEHAIPQYRVNHTKLIDSLLKIESDYPIKLHGNYLDGTSIPHQIKRSFELGAKIALTQTA